VLKEGARAGDRELIEHCQTGLAPYTIPRQIELRDHLPMSAVGKVSYRVLRDEVANV
jgi:acyl-CoA synthetase (AMP-forming)/AMP-acid ligase II